MTQAKRNTLFAGSAILLATCGAVGMMLLRDGGGEAVAEAPRSTLTLDKIPFNGEEAYTYLKKLCEIGPRRSGSTGMAAQQKLLEEHFKGLGATVTYQPFRTRHPETGEFVSMANMIIEWHPDRKERVLIAAHYDTRPFPDQDPDPAVRKQDVFVGANDGASGTALLMELGKSMPKLESKYGVDFVLLDAEEFVFEQQRDPYFLGSEWFALQYVKMPPAHKYRWGILLDMIGDADLQIYQERNSLSWDDTKPLVIDLWKTAERLGVKEFIPRRKHEVRDDHLPLRNIAKIPTCDVIDFDYPESPRNKFWHTAADTPARCSALSLAKVGWVLEEWLKSQK